MMEWAQPRDLGEWAKRNLTLRTAIIFLLFSGVLISELRFDWIEDVVGTYLVTTNPYRPESGAIWEVGQKTMTAKKNLEQIVTLRKSLEEEARNAQNLAQVIENLESSQGTMITREHFLRLYFNLPPILSQEIFSPYTLLGVANSGRWERTYFERSSERVAIYLLDQENRVLNHLELPQALVEYVKRGEVAISGSLNNLADFANRIYPADPFFATLATLPEEIQKGIVPQPLSLLKTSGRIVRVGISDAVEGGHIEIGFEIQDGAKTKVVLARGKEWDVWRLRTLLEGGRDQGHLVEEPLVESAVVE
jgi:hypothetical protein